jgi:hypothetical protein
VSFDTISTCFGETLPEIYDKKGELTPRRRLFAGAALPLSLSRLFQTN